MLTALWAQYAEYSRRRQRCAASCHPSHSMPCPGDATTDLSCAAKADRSSFIRSVADREGGCDEDAKIRSLSAQAGWMAECGHIGACQAAGLPHEGPGKALGAQDRACTLLDPELWTVLVLVWCSK